jgi:hypothetical protein
VNKLPFLIAVGFVLVLIFSGCTDQELAATERVIRGGVDGYYGRPAVTGYYQPQPVAPAYAPVYTY